MKRWIFVSAMVMLCVAFSACGGGSRRSSADGERHDTLRMEYSRLLTIVEHEDCREVKIANPWKPGQTLHTYLLVPRGAGSDDREQWRKRWPEATVVKVPLRKAVSFTTVHASLMVELGHADVVSGLADTRYVKNDVLRLRLKRGQTADVGDGMNPDVERIVDLSPDVALVSPFENSGGYGKLDKTGIALLECADYMEPTPLGRAEWIRLYGMLVGEEPKADSLFRQVKTQYNDLAQWARGQKDCPTVMMDKMTGTTWYVPGGRSTLGQMLKDAHMRYVYADDTTSGSVPLSVEKAIDMGIHADLWLLRYSGPELDYAALGKENGAYRQLPPYQHGQCYGCSTDRSLFYEQTPFHPERLLADFVLIAHPSLAKDCPARMRPYFGIRMEPHYFKPLARP